MFYDTIGHAYWQYKEAGYDVDKVPYLWDFGFLLCRENAWRNFGEKELSIPVGNGESRKKRVRDVWDALLKGPSPSEAMPSEAMPSGATPSDATPSQGAASWREFLEACVLVAEAQAQQEQGPVYPFDVDLVAVETISCLVLEMWASEVLLRKKQDRWNVFLDTVMDRRERESKWPRRDPQWRDALGPDNGVFLEGRHDYYGPSLIDLLRGFSWELYRVWLLLSEVFAHPQFPGEEFDFRSRPAYPSSVATRHWYSTACPVVAAHNVSDPLVVVGLPGSYAMRGDWFLAIAKGSRSPRLGERAIDLLCSRRANIMRLRDGLGLPVRDVVTEVRPKPAADDQRPTREQEAEFTDEQAKKRAELWTALSYWGQNGKRCPLKYGDVLRLGSSHHNNPLGRNSFHWLWRSTIWNYDRHNRIWRGFLYRLLQVMPGSLERGAGFRLYDDPAQPTHESHKKFTDLLEVALEALERGTSKQDPKPPKNHGLTG